MPKIEKLLRPVNKAFSNYWFRNTHFFSGDLPVKEVENRDQITPVFESSDNLFLCGG